jgi:hypothetical protein
MSTWLTEVNVPVVELEEEGPWYWVVLTNALQAVKRFWYRGDPQRVMDAALENDIRRVEIVPEPYVNDWRTE